MRHTARITSTLAAALVLAACGGVADDSTSDSLPVIHLAGGGSGAAATEDAMVADSMRMAANVTYVASGELPALDTPATAWRFPPGAQPDPAAVARIAAAFGVEGQLAELPVDQGGGWVVGPTDGSAAALYVSADPQLSWYYSAPYDASVRSSECTSVDPAVTSVDPAVTVPPVTDPMAGSGGGSAGSVVPGGVAGTEPAPDTPVETVVPTDSAPVDPAVDTVVDPAVTPPPVECSEPEPPVGVPTADEAEAATRTILEAIGVDLSAVTFETYADEWSASVTAWRSLDGVRSPISASVGFAGEGAISYASGSLSEPVAVGQYPRVGTAAGLDRLNSDWMERYWAVSGDPMPLAANTDVASREATDAGATVEEPSVSVDANTSGSGSATPDPGTGGAVEGGVPAVPAPDPNTATEVAPPPEEITVTISSVEADLWQVWDRDGSMWLVPAYAFVDVDGGRTLIPAVPDEYLDLAPVEEVPPATEPAPDTVPTGSDVPVTEPTVPSTDGTVVSPPDTVVPPDTTVVLPTQADLEALVGLTEDEAQKLVEERGWTWRVVEHDGEGLAVTDDYREDRVDVRVAERLVLEATTG